MLEESMSRNWVKGAIMEFVTGIVFRKMSKITKDMIPTPATMLI